MEFQFAFANPRKGKKKGVKMRQTASRKGTSGKRVGTKRRHVVGASTRRNKARSKGKTTTKKFSFSRSVNSVIKTNPTGIQFENVGRITKNRKARRGSRKYYLASEIAALGQISSKRAKDAYKKAEQKAKGEQKKAISKLKLELGTIEGQMRRADASTKATLRNKKRSINKKIADEKKKSKEFDRLKKTYMKMLNASKAAKGDVQRLEKKIADMEKENYIPTKKFTVDTSKKIKKEVDGLISDLEKLAKSSKKAASGSKSKPKTKPKAKPKTKPKAKPKAKPKTGKGSTSNATIVADLAAAASGSTTKKKSAKKKAAKKKAAKKKAAKKKATKKKVAKKKATKKKVAKKKATKKKATKKKATKKKVAKKKATKKKVAKKKATKKKASKKKTKKRKAPKKPSSRAVKGRQAARKRASKVLQWLGFQKKGATAKFTEIRKGGGKYEHTFKKLNPNFGGKMQNNSVYKATFGRLDSMKVKSPRSIVDRTRNVAIDQVHYASMGAVAAVVGNRLHDLVHENVWKKLDESAVGGNAITKGLRDFSSFFGQYGLSALFSSMMMAGLSETIKKYSKGRGRGVTDTLDMLTEYCLAGGTVSAAYNFMSTMDYAQGGSFQGVDFTPMQGVDFTPMQGVDFTPMGTEESGADFGFEEGAADFGGVDFTPMSGVDYTPMSAEESSADFGFEEGAADFGAEESSADFGMYDDMDY